ncbi:MAG: hypothetical protein K2J06_08975, partial [Muribaculaceae bacterium]|nr:hypothetical protein [Muribaculaceae bacterium]
MMELPAGLHTLMIRRGSILHSEMFENIDHGKFFVIIGVSEESVAGFFFINSRIHPAIMRRPDQLEMQYELTPADYTFLNHTSYLCATVIQEIPIARLSATFADRTTTCVGQLRES